MDTELVYQTGRADAVTYRANEGAGAPDAAMDARALEQLVWIAIHRRGPIDRERLGELVPADGAALRAALGRLESQGLVRLRGDRYESETCVIPFDDPAGWEAFAEAVRVFTYVGQTVIEEEVGS